MTNKQTRDVQRWVHLGFAVALAVYVYSPWTADPTFALAMKAVVFPVLALSGVALWQWTRLRKRLSGSPAAAPPRRPLSPQV